MTDNMVTAEAVTKTPADAAAAGEALAGWLREQLWADGPYEQPDADFVLIYEDDFSQEDHAAPRDTAIMRTTDGRYWHATITVTAVEQTVRTPVEDDEDDEPESTVDGAA